MKPKNNFYLLLVAIIILLLAGCSTLETRQQSPEELYSDALARMEGSKSLFGATDYLGAKVKLEEITRKYSFTKYAPLAELRLADIYFKKDQYEEAILAYQDFISLHPNHQEVHYALYQIGLAYFKEIDTVDRDVTPAAKALTSFDTLLSRFPESKYGPEASAKSAFCKDILSGNEFYVGQYYYKRGHYKAAAKRFRATLEKFPGYGPKEDALLFLGKSFLANNEREKGINTLNNLIKAFPESDQAAESRKLLDNEKKLKD